MKQKHVLFDCLLPSVLYVGAAAHVRVAGLTAPKSFAQVSTSSKAIWLYYKYIKIKNHYIFGSIIRKYIKTSVIPVSGGWCEWSEWTPCTRTCGAESVSRYRSCSCPEPKAGGDPCSGEQEMHSGIGVQIQRQPCPVITFCPSKILHVKGQRIFKRQIDRLICRQTKRCCKLITVKSNMWT